MPGIVDVLLKITGDSRDAVRSVDDVGTAAERSTSRVGRLGESLAATGARLSAIAGGISAIVAGYAEVLSRADQALQPNPQEDVGLASSAADTAARLQSARGLRFSDVLGNLRHLSRIRGPLAGGGNPSGDDRVRAAIDDLARSNPAQLAAAIPYLPDSDAEYARNKLNEAQAASAYQQSLKPQTATRTAATTGHTVIVNSGVGDPNRVGDEVAQALQRANRNNARQYTTTVTRG